MSFSRPQRSPHRTLRHSRNAARLTDLHQARHSRNCFPRRPLRASHAAQCLLPSNPDAAANDAAISTSYSVTAYTTTAYINCEGVSGSDSEYSEYDLVNEQMQDFLLDSEDTSDGDADVEDILGFGAVFMGGLIPARPRDAHQARAWRRTTKPNRRRMAKKSESCSSLSNAARPTASSSTTMLSDLDTNVREAVVTGGAAQRRGTRKQRRAMASGERRWLVPPLSAVSVKATDDRNDGRRQLPWFTVVFDLDETLVGARYGPIHLRPHVGELLRSLHRLPVEIIVWTAGTAHYVNPILHAIGQACGRRQWFHHIISRHKRWYRGANTCVKDLRQLGRPLDRLLMVENNPISALPQPSLCVLLEDYLQPNAADESLLVLKELLERLSLQYEREARTSFAASTCEQSAEEDCRAQRHTRSPKNTLRDATTSRTTALPSSALPSLELLVRDDAALQLVEFRMEDILKEDGVSMLQRAEMRELVGGADTLRCLCLCYTPPLLPSSTAVAPRGTAASVSCVPMAMRSYGSVNPLRPL
ncbi:conserved hypothetical protein [Leishmania infantum JPCM5]|uniref:Mitochondrial import inner membrane translocase subunit TIM50 n=2 Tax=Leishmania infantum TaxID=5671 RepID=A0A6L0XZN5_LEIIN|nr:conserved hypothetical protein [Leishmania infantum JPCM5]CAC9541331.1 NLI_interacting_factor-like_phosphatase_-_putative [Leishmania infantum]CAM71818.1 conserved hypothetical protein [Leishmania infantum JPCM5]SUZ45773.1 NLI_interacting_factor-like_phosphatase_-_putative [Leishmania infantum]|eukprot:XP_001468730.1 conserved hypothetical protein [Leishmania infantum JPCM5]